MAEPIEEIQTPKTRTCHRYSFYFTNALAQDFNVFEEDSVETFPEWFVIARPNGMRESVNLKNVAWLRIVTLDVPTPRKREPKKEA
jgi:hypothetical protein